MSPLTVVHVAGSAQWAGGEIFLKQMADKLDRSRFALRVICPEDGPLQDEMLQRKIPCETIPLSPLGNPFPIKKLTRQFELWHTDIVQSHGARSNFYTRLAAKDRPNISTIHNALSDYPVGLIKKYIYARMDAKTAPKATVLACVSDSLRNELIGRIPSVAGRTRVLHNGVDLTVFDPAKVSRERMRNKLNLASHFTIGVIGRMTEQKGHTHLLQALRDIKQNLPPFRLVLVGDGPLRKSLEEEIQQYGLSGNTLLMGVRYDVPEILSALDLLVMPSLSEGFPYVLLEALAMNCPVLATNVNGVGEILNNGECGAVISSANSRRISEALLVITKNPEPVRQRVLAGRQRVEKLFTLDLALQRWTSLYEELAASRRIN